MENDFYSDIYNPDVLSCLANLSNDEVFTPPQVVNQILDMLPQEIFSNPTTTFLDPACKSGVFLREIAKRLLKGLESTIPDLHERIDHIFHKQLFAVAITEMTSLLSRRSVYCSKYPNSIYSVSNFNDADGNIRYKQIQHRWEGEKCMFCGASQNQYDRDDALETHAYELIHTTKPEDIFKMKFDVIIGNPPYQLNTGTSTAQAIPLYNKFVEQAKKMEPRFLSMIIPSRWFAGGMGLDNFRAEMLGDSRIKIIVDYPNAKDCFPGISLGGGVCYFLWERDYNGACEFTNVTNGNSTTLTRQLNEFSVFVRYNQAISIIQKVRDKKENSLTDIVSSLNPFGFGSAERGESEPVRNSVTLFSSKGKGYVKRNKVLQGLKLVDKFKVMMSKVTSEHAGEPDKGGMFKVVSKMQLLRPKEICTFSYFIVGDYDNEDEGLNLLGYLSTKFARFLLLQSVSSINISKDKFCFVPLQDFSKSWTDDELYKKYELTNDEISFIESMIKPIELGGDENA